MTAILYVSGVSGERVDYQIKQDGRVVMYGYAPRMDDVVRNFAVWESLQDATGLSHLTASIIQQSDAYRYVFRRDGQPIESGTVYAPLIAVQRFKAFVAVQTWEAL